MMVFFKDIFNCVFIVDFYFEFIVQGIDKVKVFDIVLILMGIYVENVIVFGDGYNDIIMVEYVGIGIVM